MSVATVEAAASRRRRSAHAPLEAWFDDQGWRTQPFQRETWNHYLDGRSGLLHAPTGSGKTLAVWGGPLLDAVAERGRRQRQARPHRLRHLWITPLKALATDTAHSLQAPLEALGLDWRVGLRTGDTSARDKRLARRGEFDVLVTTPESLALLLSYADSAAVLAGLRSVVVDEWHELLGNKRGVLLELGLARLRSLAPALRTWGLSATLGNLGQARAVLLPGQPGAALVLGPAPRPPRIETLLPDSGERFPWAGHLGLRQLPRVLARVMACSSSLLFTNTRSQAELWHQALQAVWPAHADQLAIHHGSLDPRLRRAVEDQLRQGRLRCVVATSSLDLGVDFPAVEQVIQVGSPRGIGRLVQRAGRSGHRPDGHSRIVCVPTHALELLEFAAAREALREGHTEPRRPLRDSLDVLAQHVITLGLGGGFDPDALLREVRSTHAFAALTPESWNAVLDFATHGGSALAHYPDYRRLERDDDGRFHLRDRRQALRHRLSLGTIVSDGSVQVRLLRGGRLGTVEEAFVARLKPGARFAFAGRTVEFVRLRDMTVYVRLAPGGRAGPSRWMGARMPMSAMLGETVTTLLDGPRDARRHPELAALQSLLDLQARVSALPGRGHLLVETLVVRGEQLLLLFPFAGRQVHEGLAAIVALRLGRERPNSFSTAVSDHGLVLTLAEPVEIDEARLRRLLAVDGLDNVLAESLNLGELTRRQFREVARVAGLLPPSLPGRASRSLRQLQASSGLIHDVLRQHDPGHLLLAQAEGEALDTARDGARLDEVLQRIASMPIHVSRPAALTPFGFPLWAESIRDRLSTEDWRTRVMRAAARLEGRFE